MDTEPIVAHLRRVGEAHGAELARVAGLKGGSAKRLPARLVRDGIIEVSPNVYPWLLVGTMYRLPGTSPKPKQPELSDKQRTIVDHLRRVGEDFPTGIERATGLKDVSAELWVLKADGLVEISPNAHPDSRVNKLWCLPGLAPASPRFKAPIANRQPDRPPKPVRVPDTRPGVGSALRRQTSGDKGVGSMQQRALEALADGPMTIGELTRAIGSSYAIVNTMLFRLSERGLVTVDGSPRTAKLSG